MSLRSRIALIAAALVLAAVLVSTLLQTLAARWAVLEQARESGNTVAEMLARAVSFAEAAPRSMPCRCPERRSRSWRWPTSFATAPIS